ncbi:MAG: hypothetical protein IPK85_05315 [Gemmatimonadetes bacterium]|nr:hypothetical protein [Gemmatimonadota bacterium]
MRGRWTVRGREPGGTAAAGGGGRRGVRALVVVGQAGAALKFALLALFSVTTE